MFKGGMSRYIKYINNVDKAILVFNPRYIMKVLHVITMEVLPLQITR